VLGDLRRAYLFEARWHAPATGLHNAVIAAHVLPHLPVLFTALLSAGQQCRVTEERRNTVTGQSGSNGREGRKSEALAAWPASSRRQREEEMKTGGSQEKR